MTSKASVHSYLSDEDESIISRQLTSDDPDERDQASRRILVEAPKKIMHRLLEHYRAKGLVPNLSDLQDAVNHALTRFRYETFHKAIWKRKNIPTTYIVEKAIQYLEDLNQQRIDTYYWMLISEQIPEGPIKDAEVQDVISRLHKRGEKYRKYREIYRLRYGFNYSPEELAELFQTSEDNVRQLCSRAKSYAYTNTKPVISVVNVILMFLFTAWMLTYSTRNISHYTQQLTRPQHLYTSTLIESNFNPLTLTRTEIYHVIHSIQSGQSSHYHEIENYTVTDIHEFDTEGQLLRQVTAIDSAINDIEDHITTTTYAYDAEYRLLDQITTFDSAINDIEDRITTTTYAYDEQGNILRQVITADSLNDDSEDRTFTTTYVYDQNGILAQVTEQLAFDSRTHNFATRYYYDGQGRLSAVVTNYRDDFERELATTGTFMQPSYPGSTGFAQIAIQTDAISNYIVAPLSMITQTGTGNFYFPSYFSQDTQTMYDKYGRVTETTLNQSNNLTIDRTYSGPNARTQLFWSTSSRYLIVPDNLEIKDIREFTLYWNAVRDSDFLINKKGQDEWPISIPLLVLQIATLCLFCLSQTQHKSQYSCHNLNTISWIKTSQVTRTTPPRPHLRSNPFSLTLRLRPHYCNV